MRGWGWGGELDFRRVPECCYARSLSWLQAHCQHRFPAPSSKKLIMAAGTLPASLSGTFLQGAYHGCRHTASIAFRHFLQGAYHGCRHTASIAFRHLPPRSLSWLQAHCEHRFPAPSSKKLIMAAGTLRASLSGTFLQGAYHGCRHTTSIAFRHLPPWSLSWLQAHCEHRCRHTASIAFRHLPPWSLSWLQAHCEHRFPAPSSKELIMAAGTLRASLSGTFLQEAYHGCRHTASIAAGTLQASLSGTFLHGAYHGCRHTASIAFRHLPPRSLSWLQAHCEHRFPAPSSKKLIMAAGTLRASLQAHCEHRFPAPSSKELIMAAGTLRASLSGTFLQEAYHGCRHTASIAAGTLRASLSGTFLQSRKDVVNQRSEFGLQVVAA